MYIKKMYGYILPFNEPKILFKGLLDYYKPPKISSNNYTHWVAQLDLTTCLSCRSNHGKIYPANKTPSDKLPVHPKCRCIIKMMDAVHAGHGTKDDENGADWWIKNYRCLPNYYITENDLLILGWKRGKSPAIYAPGKMVTMGTYRNDDGHLPQSAGRIWYEADINYSSGKRNGHRLLWSNDGLIFVTYDHYATFLEII